MSEILTKAIYWQGDRLELLDQRRLPAEENWWSITTAEDTAAAISVMAVRGAPAIGITAAYGLVLASHQQGDSATREKLQTAHQTLAASRPTAINLRHALERLDAIMGELSGTELASKLEDEAVALHTQDLERNRRLAEHGAMLFTNSVRIYTHCNTGGLATGGHGTALGIVRTAHEKGILRHVYAGETRPWLQGSRLTMWELLRDSIPASLVIDSCAGELMRRQAVDAVVVGADRVSGVLHVRQRSNNRQPTASPPTAMWPTRSVPMASPYSLTSMACPSLSPRPAPPWTRTQPPAQTSPSKSAIPPRSPLPAASPWPRRTVRSITRLSTSRRRPWSPPLLPREALSPARKAAISRLTCVANMHPEPEWTRQAEDFVEPIGFFHRAARIRALLPECSSAW